MLLFCCPQKLIYIFNDYLCDNFHTLCDWSKYIRCKVGICSKKCFDFSIDIWAEWQIFHLIFTGYQKSWFHIRTTIVIKLPTRIGLSNYAGFDFGSSPSYGPTFVNKSGVVGGCGEIRFRGQNLKTIWNRTLLFLLILRNILKKSHRFCQGLNLSDYSYKCCIRIFIHLLFHEFFPKTFKLKK